ncbi:phosphoadenosine phosphosulfate reductase domain-containing protein [Breznakia pachnodae]|uniref:3'-phosphoadenosine 5'-phosphosulfate sulfotransferase (PAPS reductase)/FAD synthetase n=1 Tax=Breznakia pachnodae TaxID=265178 RepID=A0ABU0E409_9FIRM|nr:phosphoadenosine phosphosulfate reductase family protein [Breznakia pachnodae]MDQ0361627.1 3'-phosphoadenosine 5'-phosphosulfate sulfotransferase (PAPS reductase)/FAD synthetase [Breznakia pachnodae]
MRHIVQFSGGKDSTAMLNLMIEKGMPIDEVVFFDTTWEFDAVYENIKQHKMKCETLGIKFTTIKSEHTFDYLAFEKDVRKRDGTHQKGYSWCGGLARWGTSEKIRNLEKYCRGNIEYIGFAHDEQQRIVKKRKGIKVFPLNDWEMTEADALNHCYKNGIEYIEEGFRLYDLLDRASCFCCGNKNLKELRNMYNHLPDYWDRLKSMQCRTSRLYRKVGIHQLEHRFEKELY